MQGLNGFSQGAGHAGVHAASGADDPRHPRDALRTLTDRGVDLQALFEKRYAGEPFVDVMPPGSHPETRSVRASNVCRIAVHRPQGGDTAVILAVMDNLVKGAAGQAIQNMNLMFGLPETTGLTAPPVMPLSRSR